MRTTLWKERVLIIEIGEVRWELLVVEGIVVQDIMNFLSPPTGHLEFELARFEDVRKASLYPSRAGSSPRNLYWLVIGHRRDKKRRLTGI